MKRNSLTWLVAAAGIAFSLAFFSTYRSWESAYVQTELDVIGGRKAYSIDETLHNDFVVVMAMKAFFESSSRVDPDEFYSFTRGFLEKNPAIQALAWAPRVSHGDRAGFEAKQKEQAPGYRMTERDDGNGMVSRNRGREYYPVTLIEPLAGNENAMGFDMASNPVRRAAILASREKGEMVVTEKVTLVNEAENMSGVLLFVPVYRDPVAREEFLGFVIGAFRVADIVEKSILHYLNTETRESEIRLTDITDPASPEVLYVSSGFWDAPEFYYETNFDLGGRRWAIRIVPTPGFLAEHKSNIAVVGLGAGLMFTLLLFVYLRAMAGQSEEIRRQVVDRTRELSRHKDELDNLINTIKSGIIMIDSNRIIQLFNPSAEKIFQYCPGEVVGKNVNLLMPEPFHSNHDDYVTNYVRTGESKIIGIGREVRGRRKDGTEFPMFLAISEMKIENTRYFVGSVSDISHQKETEERLRFARDTAEKANTIKSDFMNTMSHELRTPLTIILGNIEELVDEDELPDADEIAEIARDCSNAGEMLMLLINDILDLSKIEAGKMDLHKEPVLSSTLIADVAKTASVLANNKGLELRIQGDEVEIEIDAIRIKQTLFNLLSNAVKFTDEGSVSIITRIEGGWFVITVADTGCGMDSDSLKYIFDPFRQVDNSATRKTGGTGLGLAITRKLVELHHGNIRVESVVGEGSAFTMKLPL
ncbi:MAG: CHASE domain-containing protein [Desulfobacter sp.]